MHFKKVSRAMNQEKNRGSGEGLIISQCACLELFFAFLAHLSWKLYVRFFCDP